MHKYLISAENYQEILEAEKATKSKRVSRKLNILLVRFGGKNIAETAKQMNCSESRVKRTVAEYMKIGLQEFMKPKQKGNHRNLTVEEEKALLSRFEEIAFSGKIVEVKEIKQAFDEQIGKETGNSYIFCLTAVNFLNCRVKDTAFHLKGQLVLIFFDQFFVFQTHLCYFPPKYF